MRRCVLLLCAGVMLFAGGQALAHHSFGATYDSTQRIEIEGTVKEFVWRNPHSFLRIDVPGNGGEMETWALEWGSISQLTRSSLTRTSLRPGDQIVVSGEPARDQSSLRLLIVSIRRPADGWEWQGRVE